MRVGILGFGSIGRTHLAAINALAPRAQVVAYATSAGSGPAADGPSDARHLSPDELVAAADIDVVAIASPSEYHAQHALAAMGAGKGVVVEKPLATTGADARTVVERWRATGVLGAVISQRRLEPQHVRIKQLLDCGELGRPVLAEALVHWVRDASYYKAAGWRTKAPGGGVLMNQALHSVDLLTWLMGPTVATCGFTATLAHEIDAEDTAAAALRFRSGALGIIAASTATPPGSPARLMLATDRGSLTLDQSELIDWRFPGVERPGDTAAVGSGASDPAAIGHIGHLKQWKDILTAFEHGAQPTISLEQGLEAVEVIEAIHRYAAGAGWPDEGGQPCAS